MALVSAHRGGAGAERALENTIQAFEAAIATGCDFVEFDVRLTADSRAVLFHDDELRSSDGPRSIADNVYDDITGLVELNVVLDLLADRAQAHVDLKVPGGEIELVQLIVDALGVENVVITSAEDSSVRALIDWSRTHAPGLRIGLSSSARSHRSSIVSRWRAATAAWFPRRRLRRSCANVVVAHHVLAKWWLRAYARRRQLPLIVWTVDEPDDLDYWMNDPDTWIVTTNFPQRALEARR